MDMERLGEKAELVKELFDEEHFPDEIKGVPHEPEAVFNWLVDQAVDTRECECPKCTGVEITLTLMAAIVREMFSNQGLEWSDRQKAEICKSVLIIVAANVSVMGMINDYGKKKAKEMAALALLAGAADPDAVKGSFLKMVGGRVEKAEAVSQALNAVLGVEASPEEVAKPSRRGRPRRKPTKSDE